MNQLVYIFFLLICLSRLFLYLILYIFRITIIIFWFSAMFTLKRHLKTQQSPVILNTIGFWGKLDTSKKSRDFEKLRFQLPRAQSPWEGRRESWIMESSFSPSHSSLRCARAPYPLPVPTRAFLLTPSLPIALRARGGGSVLKMFSVYTKRKAGVFQIPTVQERFRKAPFTRWTSVDCASMKAWKPENKNLVV